MPCVTEHCPFYDNAVTTNDGHFSQADCRVGNLVPLTDISLNVAEQLLNLHAGLDDTLNVNQSSSVLCGCKCGIKEISQMAGPSALITAMSQKLVPKLGWREKSILEKGSTCVTAKAHVSHHMCVPGVMASRALIATDRIVASKTPKAS